MSTLSRKALTSARHSRRPGKLTKSLLEPVLAILDSVALEAGGLRISILTVVKGVLVLSVLLWGARLASGLLERRLTRMPELTPIAQVLLGKLPKTTLFILAVVVALASAGIDMS